MERSVEKIIYDWFFMQEEGEVCRDAQVGRNGVTRIIEHEPRGDGDMWFYDIHYTNGSVRRIFNINEVTYFPRNELGGGSDD